MQCQNSKSISKLGCLSDSILPGLQGILNQNTPHGFMNMTKSLNISISVCRICRLKEIKYECVTKPLLFVFFNNDQTSLVFTLFSISNNNVRPTFFFFFFFLFFLGREIVFLQSDLEESSFNLLCNK